MRRQGHWNAWPRWFLHPSPIPKAHHHLAARHPHPRRAAEWRGLPDTIPSIHHADQTERTKDRLKHGHHHPRTWPTCRGREVGLQGLASACDRQLCGVAMGWHPLRCRLPKAIFAQLVGLRESCFFVLRRRPDEVSPGHCAMGGGSLECGFMPGRMLER